MPSFASGAAKSPVSYGHQGGYVLLPGGEFSGGLLRQQGRKAGETDFFGG
jgi:hypothetical protein